MTILTPTLKRGISIAALLLMPGLARAQAPAAADSSRPRPRGSWTSDRREFVVGDIITVLVDESTLASANKGQSGTDQQSRDLGLNVPVGPLAGSDLSISSKKGSTSTQNGQASRNLSFKGQMTVRVTKVEPSGVMEVKGARTVDVDKNKQQLTLTGFVRPQDVSRDNVVASARIADAQLLYSLSGDMGATRGGIIGRLVSVFWP
ncbi:MAG: flagellar basal body L-ring protein FlgH [bacterium]